MELFSGAFVLENMNQVEVNFFNVEKQGIKMETNQLNVSRKNYVKSLLTIAVPIMLGNIISQVQMLVDKAFLGHVNEFYLSALGNVSSPMWTSMSFCFTIVT